MYSCLLYTSKVHAKDEKICFDQEKLVDEAPILKDKATVLEPEVKPVTEKITVVEATKKPTEKAKEEVSDVTYE